jgi:hypothetical protein
MVRVLTVPVEMALLVDEEEEMVDAEVEVDALDA